MIVSSRSGTYGFTLIELVIALAITGIVAALAVSAYRTYSVRAQVAEGLRLLENLQSPIIDAFELNDEPPADRLGANLSTNPADTSARYVSSVNVSNGRIDLRFGNNAHPAISQRTLSLTPYETANLAVVWICGNQIPGLGLKPLGFAGGGRQAVQIPATVEARYLPATCR